MNDSFCDAATPLSRRVQGVSSFWTCAALGLIGGLFVGGPDCLSRAAGEFDAEPLIAVAKGKTPARHAASTSDASAEPRPGRVLEHVIVEFGGRPDIFEHAGASGRPVPVSSARATGNLEVKGRRFRQNGGPAFGDRVSCERSKLSTRRNVFEDQPPCMLKGSGKVPRPAD